MQTSALIIAGDNFVARTPRFDARLDVERGSFGPEFSRADREKLGDPYEVANRVRGDFSSSVEYEVSALTDSVFLGFAAFDEELCGWGIEQQSPYA
jgi:hypothetical protein